MNLLFKNCCKVIFTKKAQQLNIQNTRNQNPNNICTEHFITEHSDAETCAGTLQCKAEKSNAIGEIYIFLQQYGHFKHIFNVHTADRKTKHRH